MRHASDGFRSLPGRIDQQRGESVGPLHRLPAGWKLAGAFAIILTVVLLPGDCASASWGVFFGVVVIVLLSRIPLLLLGKRLALLSPFVVGAALASALQRSPGSDWRILAVKSALCLLTVIVLSNLTPFGELLRVLRRVRVPALLITTMALMHRYLFVLADEAVRMRRARAGRTFNRARRFAWPVPATIVGLLFVRASERAERIYDAMCARGWK